MSEYLPLSIGIAFVIFIFFLAFLRWRSERRRQAYDTLARAVLKALERELLEEASLEDTVVISEEEESKGEIPSEMSPVEEGIPSEISPVEEGIPSEMSPVEEGIPSRVSPVEEEFEKTSRDTSSEASQHAEWLAGLPKEFSAREAQRVWKVSRTVTYRRLKALREGGLVEKATWGRYRKS